MTPPIDPKNMTCEQFQAMMPSLIASGEDIDLHPHLQNCDLCRALLDELNIIAEAAKQLLPIEEPSDEVWSKIESALKDETGAEEIEPPSADDPGKAK